METHRIHSLCKWSITWSWKPAMSPRIWSQDCGIARRCKLSLGAESERGTPVQEGLLVGPPMERRREFAAANLQAESYLEREHNARWAALGVAHPTSGITASSSLNSVLSIDVDRTYTRIECLTLTGKAATVC